MDELRKLEMMIAGWYDKVPHLSPTLRDWLATNSWWIVLIGVIFEGMGIFGVLFFVLASGLLLTGFFGVYGAAAAGIVIITTLIWMAVSIATLVLIIMAITPLREKRHRGWMLLFGVMLLAVVVAVVRLLGGHGIGEFIWSMICVAVSGYVLFEIRSQFGGAPAAVSAKSTSSAKIDEIDKKGDRSA